jgi:putative tricarboxylic transport membrane protein
MLDNFILGAGLVFQLPRLGLIFVGVVFGIIVGAIPGMTATMAIALLIPLTFGIHPIDGMALMMGTYVGGITGGLISATLINIPGTPSSIATTFDAYPLTQKGQGGKALGTGITASFIGGIFSLVILCAVAPQLAKVALKFGPYEYFSVGLFSLAIIITLSEGSLLKGILAGLFGILMGTIGIAPVDGAPRFTMGIEPLIGGLDLLPVLIGLFAIPEILGSLESLGEKFTVETQVKDMFPKARDVISNWWNYLRAALIGTGIGILPGIGGGTSNLVAYAEAKRASKHPEEFGKGAIEGIIASETANNASVGGALVPLLSLGIPGDTVTAMLIGGLMIHGLQPGPLLFQTNADVVYSIFMSLFVANIMMLFLMFGGIKFFIKAMEVPKHILLPLLSVLCILGTYATNNRMFDVWTMFVFGLVGYFFQKNRFPQTPMILGLILGPIVETNLRRGLMHSGALPFFTRPISLAFLILAVIFAVSSLRKGIKGEKASAAA